MLRAGRDMPVIPRANFVPMPLVQNLPGKRT